MRPPISLTRALVIGSFAVACNAPAERPKQPSEATRASAKTSSSTANEADDDEPVRDGKYLYTRNCSGCHNDNGDGNGATIVQMGLKARNFAEGHFAFGNTRESIFRTIASGVPGRSPMPGFAGVLTEDERWLVVDYVRTLMPKEAEVDESLSVMHVKDEPLIVRGMLRPIVEGAPEWPRGLLVGLPGGLTFAYRADDVRLLGVYQGEFVDRRDWYDRGGSKLRPLGQLIYAVDDGDPKRGVQRESTLENTTPATSKALHLVSTVVQGRTAIVSTQPFNGQTASVDMPALHETPSTLTLPIGTGWMRRLTSEAVRVRPASVLVPIGSASIPDSVDMTGLARTSTDGKLPKGMDIAMIAQPHETFVEYTIVSHPKGAGLVRADDGWSIPIAPGSEATIATVLLTPSESKRIDEVLKEVVR